MSNSYCYKSYKKSHNCSWYNTLDIYSTMTFLTWKDLFVIFVLKIQNFILRKQVFYEIKTKKCLLFNLWNKRDEFFKENLQSYANYTGTRITACTPYSLADTCALHCLQCNNSRQFHKPSLEVFSWLKRWKEAIDLISLSTPQQLPDNWE